MKANIRHQTIDCFVQTNKATILKKSHPLPKMLYRYIKERVLAIITIYLPKMVRIRKCSKKVTKANKKTFGKTIEERRKCINERSKFEH